MNILVMDELRSRRSQIQEAFAKGKYKVRTCCGSNDFINLIEDSTWDMILLDVESWNHGKSIYYYFEIGKKLENVPILFYNTSEKFAGIANRSPNDRDHVLQKPTEVATILSMVS